MKNALQILHSRNERIRGIFNYINLSELPKHVKQNFEQILAEFNAFTANIIEGFEQFTEEQITNIENWLIAGEEACYEAGVLIKKEYCDIIETLEDLRDERIIIMKFLKGELTDDMFI